ncbi:MAG: carboxypeptidase regulatory-like domain-containing protein, partial [Candidatus Acidiferrales bacterium]
MRFSIIRLLSVSILALLFIGGTTAYGQGTSASLTGQVTDSSGAVVPGATVTATSAETNLAQTAAANGDGIYLIAPLRPGHYTLTVESKGFERYSQSGIELFANVAATQNVALKTGSVQQTVTVTENAELINTTTAELGTNVNEAAVTQLPLNGRDPSSLVFLAPGTTNILQGGGQPGIQAGFSFPTETGASANGGRQGSTEYLLDGVPNMDNYMGLTAPFPNADATQEFRVITNNFNALYGFAPGAVVSIETKSGSNRFHGGGFEFLRNKALNASNGWFSQSEAKDPLRRNQFGGDLGGPIKRDKLFFFLNYQGTRSSSAASNNFTQTPTAAMLQGDFSAVPTPLCTGANGSHAPAGCPFATVGGIPNQVNPALFNQAAVTVTTTGLPLGGDANGEPGGVFYPGASVIQSFDEGTARFDYNISANQRLSFHSFIDNLIQPSEDIPGNILSVLNPNPWSEVFGERMEFYNEALSHTWTISPTAVNTVSVFWTQMSAHNAAAVKDINGQDMCWSRYINVNELPGQCYMEGFSVGGGGFSGGWTEPSQEVRTTYGLYDNFSKTVGNHVLSFGVNLQHQYAAENTQYPTTPIVGFSGQYTGNGLADWLMGYMSSYTQGAGEIAVVSGWQPGFYGQDQFRIRSNLTITAGLRWDPNIVPAVAGGRGAAFVPGQQSTLFTNAPLGLVFPGDKGIGAGLMPSTYRGYWQPRIGVAWQPGFLRNTSIRAAFGMFTAPLQYSMYNHTADISPFSPTFGLNGGTNTPLSLSDPWSQNAGTNFASPFPPFAPFKPAADAPFAPPFTIPAVFAQNFKLGVTQSWNLSVEHQFGRDFVARVAYVGSQSYHQSDIIDQNPGICGGVVIGPNGPQCASAQRTTYTNFNAILDNFSNGTASYNALQAGVEKHLSHSLQFQSNFTWSKTLDTASSGNISFGTNELPNPFDMGYNYGISSENVPFIWVSNFIYTSPLLRDKNQFIQQTLGGWELSGIVTLQSGFPFGIAGGYGDNSGSLQGGDRADVVPGQNFDVRKGGQSQWLNEYFNTAAFTFNAPGTFGDSGRNMFQGPPSKNVDAAIAKNWSVRERYNLQFRWEMFNAFNHPNFGTPDANVGDGGSFGKITSLGPMRVMQA